jgi:hypothetical protein
MLYLLHVQSGADGRRMGGVTRRGGELLFYGPERPEYAWLRQFYNESVV